MMRVCNGILQQTDEQLHLWFVETRRVPPPYLVTLARKNVSLLTNADLHMWLENSHT